MAFNRPASGPRAGRRPRPGDGPAARLPRRSSASCCRTTSCSTAPSPRTSRFARPDATRAEIRAVGRDRPLRRVHRAGSPQGYDTVVGERGVQALGRPAAARRDRARDPGRPAHPDPRRGDLEPRQRERGADPGRPAARCGTAARRSSSRTGSRPSAAPTRSWCSKAGEIVERGTHAELLAAERPLPAALRQAVPLRDRPLHQSRRGLHAGAGAGFGSGTGGTTEPLMTQAPVTRDASNPEQLRRRQVAQWLQAESCKGMIDEA